MIARSLLLLLVVSVINAQPVPGFKSDISPEFPLWGSKWVIAEGNNKRVYTSVLPLKPRKLAIIDFPADKSCIKCWYVNLDLKDYWGTSEILMLSTA